MSTGLSKKGFSVACLNSLAYFWSKKTPGTAARDLDRIINHYLTRWDKNKVWLTGVALISPSLHSDFEISISSWRGNSKREPKYPLLPELTKSEAYPVLCLAGDDDDDDCLCKNLNLTGVKSVLLPGGHHLGGDYDRLVDTLVLGLEKQRGKL
ncbi:AcvB/VirJ family lysyl-phosphatidylglycerol hydrolase [uncultured Desulfobacter sp.]|uniref:AcvB/VirJ family lysyl-phosphatidylglycerol hydrolase n=1 Tax=uncultured Desulfobacter sp. TaxID=240139 RepID=UPI002AAB295E|nr:AcvB/VirJ family lysyl-phosphatidylglycerol hydrolase [uncultured Desulfobacter sp.]